MSHAQRAPRQSAILLMDDLRIRLNSRVQITTDGGRDCQRG